MHLKQTGKFSPKIENLSRWWTICFPELFAHFPSLSLGWRGKLIINSVEENFSSEKKNHFDQRKGWQRNQVLGEGENLCCSAFELFWFDIDKWQRLIRPQGFSTSPSYLVTSSFSLAIPVANSPRSTNTPINYESLKTLEKSSMKILLLFRFSLESSANFPTHNTNFDPERIDWHRFPLDVITTTRQFFRIIKQLQASHSGRI